MRLLLTTIMLGLWISGAQAARVAFAWSASTGAPAATGYKLCYGTVSGVYTTCVDVGTLLVGTLDGLTDGGTYYVAVRAYNAEGDGLPSAQLTVVATPSTPQRAAAFFTTVTP